MVHFTKRNIITPDMPAECGTPYWDEITEWLGLVTCTDCLSAAQQNKQADTKEVAWLNVKTGGVSLTRGNDTDVPLFQR